ncbi:hypothetical protein DXG01_015640 [Tephrocybe rancida]|nr:hypothetical protein DXG01_015640 [Tephrocybe rancida]
MPTRSAYTGNFRKLVLAFDVGTTFSGISYSILDPGQIPEIKGVTRFPAQEQVGGDSKIPTIIYYDDQGNVRAVGAEALKEEYEGMIEEEGWTKTEWFKLHLRPSSTANANVTESLPPLPKNKTVLDVFSDFLGYLHKCARNYIEETHANGSRLWSSFEQHIEFVLTHPNGWEGAQQAQMRRAAVRAGLVPNTNEGRSRIHFVTEGEASLHACVQSGLTTEALKSGEGILIVDAGGGTIDMTAYGQDTTTEGLVFQEITAAQYLLEDSKFSDDVDHITRCFDTTTKLRFRNINEPQYIKFGSARDKDISLGIRAGQLKLQGVDVSTFFEPSIICIVECIIKQRKSSSKPINSVFLVGGFAASDWLFSQLKSSLEPLGLSFSRPDSHLNKAVADGGVSFYIDHFVTARVAKYAYGLNISTPYNPDNVEHLKRLSTRFTDAAGHERLPNAFSIILPKATQVSEATTFKRPYIRRYPTIGEAGKEIFSDILCYRGSIKNPRWMNEDSDLYSQLCTVSSEAPPCQEKFGKLGRYYQMDYEIVLNFGLAELTALVQWEELTMGMFPLPSAAQGQQRQSPARIVYDAEDEY